MLASGEASQHVKSFDFKTLMDRKPALKQELSLFRDHLLATSSAEETLKVTLQNLIPGTCPYRMLLQDKGDLRKAYK